MGAHDRCELSSIRKRDYGANKLNVFLINLLLLFVWNILLKPNSCKRRKIIFIVVVSTQLFLIAFFSPIVSDALMYADWARMDSYGDTNFGWKCLSKFVWFLWPNPKSLLAVVSLISVAAAAHFIYRHSSDPLLSYFIYICMGIWGYSFLVFRQSIAISICMIAYDYLKDRDYRKSCIAVLLASLFHETAIVLLVAVPFSILTRGDKRKIAVECTCIIAFTLFYKPLLSFLLSIFRNGWLYEVSTEVDGFGHLALLTAAVIGCYMLDRGNREAIFQKNIEVAALIQVLSLHFPLLVRLVHYFDLSMMVAIPSLVVAQKDRRIRLLIYVGVIALFFWIYAFSMNYGFPGGPECYVFTLP